MLKIVVGGAVALVFGSSYYLAAATVHIAYRDICRADSRKYWHQIDTPHQDDVAG